MNSPIARALAALLFAGLLWALTRGMRDQPRRRRAFELAAGALLALAAFQGALAAGVTLTPLLYTTVGAAFVLMIAAAGAYIASFRSGELDDQRKRIAEEAQRYREQREEQRRREL